MNYALLVQHIDSCKQLQSNELNTVFAELGHVTINSPEQVRPQVGSRSVLSNYVKVFGIVQHLVDVVKAALATWHVLLYVQYM